MEINATLIGQMIAFAIFVWFTMKYVWPPIEGAMQERQQKIADGLAAAEKGTQQLQAAATKVEEELKGAREGARDIVAGANRQASQILEEARAAAQAEGERIKQQAVADVEQQIAQARESLRKEVAALAMAGAAQILNREIDVKAHGEILDSLATQL